MMTLLLIQLLNLAVVAVVALLTIAFFATFRVPVRQKEKVRKEELPFVSVIVPARNEEGKIQECLQSLVGQDYPHYEIIVIDDLSEDRTGQIIEQIAQSSPRIKCLRGGEAPSGWTGKCYALSQAVTHAQGDWYVFTDADTCHSVSSLSTAISYAISEQLDMISFMPVQELGTFWERLVMPTLLGSFVIGDPFNSINDQGKKRAYAYGQYIAMRRNTYEAVGGHKSVRNQVLEDISFAAVVKAAGFRITAACGVPLYKIRMYTGLKTLWQGWTKNVYQILGSNITYLCLIIMLLNIALVAPVAELGYLLFLGLSSMQSPNPSTTALLATSFAIWCLEIAAIYLWYYKTSKYYCGTRWYDFCLLPFGSLAVSAIYIASAYRYLGKHAVEWKGRTYPVGAGAAAMVDMSDPSESPETVDWAHLRPVREDH